MAPTRARALVARRCGAHARGGRARARSASLVFVAATLACLASSDAFSLGIDVGADSTTVAASRSSSARDVSVVPDDRGGRSSPSLVGFTERHAARVLGADAESLRSQCPRCVFGDPRSLVGADVADVLTNVEDGKASRVLFPSALKRARAETGTGFLNSTDSFRPETLVAMVVEDAARRAFFSRATSEAMPSDRLGPSRGEKVSVGRKESDASIYEHESNIASSIATAALAVPGWWSQRRRRAFLDAATVAGIPRNKTTLCSEVAAVSATLALRFQDEWNKDLNDIDFSWKGKGKGKGSKQKSVTVALFGVGARSVWASAVRFTADAADAPTKVSQKMTKAAKKPSASRARIRVRAEVLQQEWAEEHGGGWALDADVAAAAVRLGKRHTSEDSNDDSSDSSRAEIARLASTDERSAARLMAAARRARRCCRRTQATLEARGTGSTWSRTSDARTCSRAARAAGSVAAAAPLRPPAPRRGARSTRWSSSAAARAFRRCRRRRAPPSTAARKREGLEGLEGLEGKSVPIRGSTWRKRWRWRGDRRGERHQAPGVRGAPGQGAGEEGRGTRSARAADADAAAAARCARPPP